MAKTPLLTACLCLLMAVELHAQGGLGAPPGRMGGGERSGSSGRAPAPSGRIPEAAPSDGAENGVRSGPANRPERATPSRPVGNILTPGSPEGPSSRNSGSSSFPGILEQPSILSPGVPGPYRPGSILTPGTPPAAPSTGGISGGGGRGNGRGNDGRGHHGRGRGGAVVYPYVYFGYPNGYGNGGYAIDTGTVTRTYSNSSYVVEGHLDEAGLEGQSRVYEVGPRSGEDGYAEPEQLEDRQREPGQLESEPADAAIDQDAPGETFDLIALQGGLIYAVHEYWLLGNTVHFVTMRGDHYVVSLQEVDLDLSVRLNRERGGKFVLEVRAEHGAGAPAQAP